MRNHLVRMAGYHRWASRRVYESVGALGERQCRAEQPSLPFHSVSGTLFHLFMADMVWYTRFISAGVPPSADSAAVAAPEPLPNAEETAVLGELALEDVGTLWRGERSVWTERAPAVEVLRWGQESMCTRWDELMAAASEESLEGSFTYHNTRGEPQEKQLGPILAHVFNQGTHHRGQLSSAICAATHPSGYPVLDLLYFIDEAS